MLDRHQYHSVLEGVVGRVRDVDDTVVNAAVETLRWLHQAGPARYGPIYEACLLAIPIPNN